jgi:hypothetical protein
MRFGCARRATSAATMVLRKAWHFLSSEIALSRYTMDIQLSDNVFFKCRNAFGKCSQVLN